MCTKYWNVSINPPYNLTQLQQNCSTDELKQICDEFGLNIDDVDDSDATTFNAALIERILASGPQRSVQEARRLFATQKKENEAEEERKRNKNGSK